MSVPEPVLGPCSSWIDGDDVAACCTSSVGSDPGLFDTVAVEASMLMFELSGRQFSGLCERTVRPCRQSCGCFAGLSGNWSWETAAWRNECGDTCGCGATSFIRLAGYPVREVSEVKIDGVVLDPSEYRLIGRRKLLRTSDPGPPVVRRRWPSCQDLTLDDDQPGTHSVTYSYGAEPPQSGRDAAAALACQLYAACDSGATCQLPNKVTTIVRQGITMERIVPLASLLRSGATGIPSLDAFIAAYNPKGMRRRPAVFSPDLAPYPKEG